MFEISFIPAFKDNYIWLLTQGKRAYVVDPGDAAPVQARLEADGLSLEGILITHHHADHQGGVAELKARWQAEVYAPGNESITGCTRPLIGGESVDVLGQKVMVMAVPGHTLGHLAYYAPGALFCGDTLFGAGCGRLFEGTPAQMSDSLDRIAALPGDTLIYCAHEYTEMNLRFALAVEPDSPALQARVSKVAALRAAGLPSVPSTLDEEKATNPFLRCHEAAVVEAGLRHASSALVGKAAQQGMGINERSKTEIFAALRSWRNNF
jgi:hydroxyacylglutathione hydrolase